ncbi:unnamed protein product [Brassica rapa]|uniref:Uncharacterized protein n=2 Tax=Brassica TaxID=3705 RepID=A0A8D9LP11_BRACM|nr:unnamed protein product [Brassica napus]CAG7881530.1 unnamed protein product [Brassica rapa]
MKVRMLGKGQWSEKRGGRNNEVQFGNRFRMGLDMRRRSIVFIEEKNDKMVYFNVFLVPLVVKTSTP